jgi:hypothetical protein
MQSVKARRELTAPLTTALETAVQAARGCASRQDTTQGAPLGAARSALGCGRLSRSRWCPSPAFIWTPACTSGSTAPTAANGAGHSTSTASGSPTARRFMRPAASSRFATPSFTSWTPVVTAKGGGLRADRHRRGPRARPRGGGLLHVTPSGRDRDLRADTVVPRPAPVACLYSNWPRPARKHPGLGCGADPEAATVRVASRPGNRQGP